MSPTVRYETRGRIAIVELNRPEARNAVDGEVAAALERSIDAIEADDEIWVGVLTANTDGQTRPVFSAGADLKALARGETSMATARGGFAGFTHRDRTKPIVVAVDGLATAGGCEIVLAADIVVATTRSSFGLAEVKRNVLAAAGGLYRLPRAIGRATAMDAILTGEPITADRAYALGLVSRLVEPGAAVEEALRLAEQIVRCAPLAVRASRTIVHEAHSRPDTELERMVAGAAEALRNTADRHEGLAAFADKREPIWQNK